MYYTIEGKRVLGILYIAGLITGTLFFNITMKMQIFKLSDFLDFTECMKMLENIDLSTFCSYVCFVRFRQLILFFIGLFLFSPYIVFCLLDYITSIFIGILLSVMVLKYGWTGMIGGVCFLFPQYVFYGMILLSAYIYYVPKKCGSSGNFYTAISRGGWRGIRTPYLKTGLSQFYLYNRVVFVGCYT
ncbi:MAG: hypothetical protein ACLTS6_16940 [Anaerobutyricum sp.]